MPEAKQKSLDEAMMETLGKATGEDATAEEQPAQEAAEAEREAEETPAQGEEAEQQEAPEREETAPAEASAKDAKTPPQAKEGKTGEQAVPVHKPPKSGTPIGWPPALHGEFYKLPREVKNQILKQQGEMARERATHQKAAKEHAEAAKRLNGYNTALAPFLPSLQAMGVQPEAAMTELFQTAHVLRSGTKAQKAQVAANILLGYDVDLGTLATFLNGKGGTEADPERTQAPPPRPKPEEFRDPRLDALLANAKRAQQQREQQTRAQLEAAKQQALQEFQELAASGEAPHFDAVLHEMDIVNAAAARRGETLTVKEVYERACHLNPEVRNLMATAEKQRLEVQAKQSQQNRTRQALSAASSVKTEPGAPAGARRKSLDDAIQDLASRYGG